MLIERIIVGGEIVPMIEKEAAVKLARTYWIVLGIAVAVILGSTSTASAQYYGRPRYYQQPPGYYPPPPGYGYRNGLVLGVGIGVGGLTADSCGDLCGAGLALEGHIGGMINPRAALMFDAWTVIHPIPNTDGDTTNTIYAGAAQFWLSPIVWLKGGIGLGNTRISSNSVGTITDATALALMGAAGVEVVHSGPFALDLQGRIGHTFYSNADGGPITDYAFMVGFNWY
jgi:hypothetical protein